jgi:hypothetical protein
MVHVVPLWTGLPSMMMEGLRMKSCPLATFIWGHTYFSLNGEIFRATSEVSSFALIEPH